MTYRVLHGKTRDTMTSEMLYDNLKPARAAYYAMEFSQWAVLLDGPRVIIDNLSTGPVVNNEEIEK